MMERTKPGKKPDTTQVQSARASMTRAKPKKKLTGRTKKLARPDKPITPSRPSPRPRAAQVPQSPAGSSQIVQMPSPGLTAQRVLLKPGHYALRHLGFAPGVEPRSGLPFATVQLMAGDATITGAGPSTATHALRAPNDTVMVSVGTKGAEVLIACFNHPGAEGAGFRFLLAPLTLPEVALGAEAQAVPRNVRLPATPPRARPAVAPVPAAPTRPHIIAVGHSEMLGDVSYGADEWIGGVGNVSLRLEGIRLHMRDAPPGLALEYGVADVSGNVTWAREGVLAGSRGSARPVHGIAARLMGAAAGAWSISYECRFAGIPTATKAHDGEICFSQAQQAHLTGVRFSLQRRTATKSEDGSRAALDFSRLRILAHIEREGDRTFEFGQWVGTPGSGRAIEGLQLVGRLPPNIEIQASDYGLNAAHWQSLEEFFGTRGQRRALGRTRFRLAGPYASHLNLTVNYQFAGDPTVFSDPDSSGGSAAKKLEALRLSISQRN